jgi:cytochrome d ubiquinol oxidase subunit I
VWSLRVPHLLSLLATADPNGEVEGINQLQDQYAAKYGAGSYKPNIPMAYWTFRLMIGFGLVAMAGGALALWFTRGGRSPDGSLFWRLSTWSIALPILANSTAWVFTEMGRQPWTVFGLLKTSDSESPTVGSGLVATSFAVLTLLYAALAVVELRLLLAAIRKAPEPPEEHQLDAPEPVFAY